MRGCCGGCLGAFVLLFALAVMVAIWQGATWPVRAVLIVMAGAVVVIGATRKRRNVP